MNADERDARHELIRRHVTAGTCYLCGLPVETFAPKHGPSGAHWECHREPYEALEKFQAEYFPKPAASTDPHPRMAFANGGHLVHFVIPATGTALCGHKPADKARHMKTRGKWLYLKDQRNVPDGYRQCGKCLTQAAARYPLPPN